MARSAPDWVITLFYSMTMLMAAVAVVTGAGTLYTKTQCTEFNTDASSEGLLAFEVFGYAAIILGGLMIIATTAALVFRFGYMRPMNSNSLGMKPMTKPADIPKLTDIAENGIFSGESLSASDAAVLPARTYYQAM